MSSNGNSFVGGVILNIGLVLLPIWIGYKTYQWIDPDSFWGVIKFLFAWGIFSAIADGIVMLVIGGLLSLFNND
ncbi:hypothetical protein [Porphyromonas sp. COT-239 OH1446]|uniref:hypothetical protein n=1 Tax=Porphyromonas sp. COT-239 OH1446 TaxID=1515613 RepID=UPI00126A2C10|nr:hypothetical protein [Porphyromonas sp. COT-239 OH1446]